jgi:hypothetical protein
MAAAPGGLYQASHQPKFPRVSLTQQYFKERLWIRIGFQSGFGITKPLNPDPIRKTLALKIAIKLYRYPRYSKYTGTGMILRSKGN